MNKWIIEAIDIWQFKTHLIFVYFYLRELRNPQDESKVDLYCYGNQFDTTSFEDYITRRAMNNRACHLRQVCQLQIVACKYGPARVKQQ